MRIVFSSPGDTRFSNLLGKLDAMYAMSFNKRVVIQKRVEHTIKKLLHDGIHTDYIFEKH